MKILTYNIRGVGSSIKWKAIRKLVVKEEVQLLCIQETKMQDVPKELCYSLWGSHDVQWSFIPSEGASGGILCLQNIHCFELKSCFKGVGIEGVWREKRCEAVVVNVYAPCDRGRRIKG